MNNFCLNTGDLLVNVNRGDDSVSVLKRWALGNPYEHVFMYIGKVIKLDEGLWPEIPEETDQVRIGIVGEIFTILEPAVNKDLIRKLQKMGALVHNSLPLSYFV
ncbi:unnamed protein product, partial [marine sediment metagenome]